MTTTTGADRLGAGRRVAVGERPAATVTTVHELTTADGATVRGVLHRIPGARTVVCLMHPRQDFTHHALVPGLLHAGLAVWTQHTRSVNNDLSLIHEQALLDVAAGQEFLRDNNVGTDFDTIVLLGHSGGGPLFAYYQEQAAKAPATRLDTTPAGRPTGFADASMPPADALVFLAPHPGQGQLLLGCIDPSVADETDPLSVNPDLDLFRTANGFADPPATSRYDQEFLTRYRAAQRERIARIDAIAREHLARAAKARAAFKRSGDPAHRRAAIAPRILTVYRTDADPRTVDLSLDPNERPYGSVFGRRPDLINSGLVGFGRLSTPEAWLSTWSGLSSQADFARAAPGVTVPTLFLELTGDQATFPTVTRRMTEALGATDLTHLQVRGTHFGGPIADGEPTGNALAVDRIRDWLDSRAELAPPAVA
jgi:hypothetical protein